MVACAILASAVGLLHPTTCPALLMPNATLNGPPKVPRLVGMPLFQIVACGVMGAVLVPTTCPASLMAVAWSLPPTRLPRNVGVPPFQMVARGFELEPASPTTCPALLMPKA